MVLKLCDFGNLKMLEGGKSSLESFQTAVAGTPLYKAAEVE